MEAGEHLRGFAGSAYTREKEGARQALVMCQKSHVVPCPTLGFGNSSRVGIVSVDIEVVFELHEHRNGLTVFCGRHELYSPR